MLDHRSTAINRHVDPAGQHHSHSPRLAAKRLATARKLVGPGAVIGAAFFFSILRASAELFRHRRRRARIAHPAHSARLSLRQRSCSPVCRHARLAQGMVSAWAFAALAARARAHQQHDRYSSAKHLRTRRARFRHAHPLCAHYAATAPHVFAELWHVHCAWLRRNSRCGHSGISGARPRLSQARFAAALGGLRHWRRSARLSLQLHPALRSCDLLSHCFGPSCSRGRGQAGGLRNRKLLVSCRDPDLSPPRERKQI